MPDPIRMVDDGRGRRPSTEPVAVSHMSTEINKTGSWKYIRPVFRDRVSPCNEGCPVGVDVEGYMALLREGRIDEAVDLLAREHPMPAVTGRVCNHPCEDRCHRGHFDGAVAIHAVERMLGDRLLAGPLPQPTVDPKAEAVAVVGSGPAGLACAYHLARLGYRVDVVEREEQPGGMLRYGIPEYRLPRAVLDRQIAHIEALGVTIHCGGRVTEASWPSLRERYAAVFFATGADIARPLGVPGEELKGVWQGLAFLRQVNAGERPKLGERVAVIGGGNTAMDCARTALRLGAHPVVVYRRTRAEMPAIPDEIEDAEREGVEFVFLAAPKGFEGEQGRVAGVACSRMALGEPGPDGRRQPVPTGEEFVVPVDAVLLATGEDPEMGPLPDTLARNGGIAVDQWGATSLPQVYAGGDVAGDERTVARALGAGKRAAIGIDRALRLRRGDALPAKSTRPLRWGKDGAPSISRWRRDDPVRRTGSVNEVVPLEDINFAHFQRVARHEDGRAQADAQAPFAEVNRGLADDVALAEAGRCFNCAVCTGCEVCLIFCADVAIHRLDGDTGPRLQIDQDYCKGCGVCAQECPRGAISMTREGI
jgi:NADPH-dependent glutamate synthase beta subunit-like oxidoreductase/ferredoxin